MTSNNSTTPQASILTAINQNYGCQASWIEALAAQDLSAGEFELIVVDAAQSEGRQRTFRSVCDQVRIVDKINYQRLNNAGRARALNHALDIARGDVIIFLGDDFVVRPNFVAAHLEFHFKNPEIGAVAVGNAIIPAEAANRFGSWLERTGKLFGIPFSADMSQVPESFFYVGNSSVKRALIDRVGRFNEGFRDHAWDDFELGERLRAAGMKATYLPAVSAVHAHSISLADREETMRRSGAAARFYVSINPGVYEWSDLLGRSSFSHWWHRITARARMLMAKTEEAEQLWWERCLDAAFAEGYRNPR